MQTHPKKTSMFCLLSLLVCITPLLANDVWEDVLKGCTIAGLVAVSIGGIVGLYKWISYESDTQLIQNARIEYTDLYALSKDCITLLERAYQIHTLTPSDSKRIISDINEAVLYEIALQFWRNKKSIDNYRNSLQMSIINLHTRRSQLLMRIHALKQDSYTNYNQMAKEMEGLAKTLEQWLPHFELLRDYLWYHRTYFALFEKEDTIRVRYQYELQAMTDQPYNRDYIKQQIKQAIALRQLHENYKYPYMHYVEEIDGNVADLKKCLEHTTLPYTDRIGWSAWTKDSLHYIKQLVIADYSYIQELEFRERQKNERCEEKAIMHEDFEEQDLQKHYSRYQQLAHKPVCLLVP